MWQVAEIICVVVLRSLRFAVRVRCKRENRIVREYNGVMLELCNHRPFFDVGLMPNCAVTGRNSNSFPQIIRSVLHDHYTHEYHRSIR